MAGIVRRARWWLVAAAALVVVFVVVWFEPQALFIDQVVDEDLPSSTADADAATTAATEAPDDSTPAPTAPVASPSPTPAGRTDLAGGTFGSLGRYTTTGQLRIVELDDGSRVVRFEDFATDNGPDLLVYLSTAPADGSGDFAAEFVDLGELRGNIGNQNYVLPPDVDLDAWRSVVIWCRRFATAFGAADLVPAA